MNNRKHMPSITVCMELIRNVPIPCKNGYRLLYAKPACQPPPTSGKPSRKSARLAPALHSVTVVGRGGSARPHSRTSHGSLLEPAVTSLAAEPALWSLDNIDEDVDRPSPSSRAAAALAAARAFSAASRSGQTTRPARSRPFIVCRHN
jgi:hypothetical protein